MGVQLAAAEVDESSAEEDLKRIRAVKGLQYEEKTVTAAKARAMDDPEVQAAETLYRTARAYRKMVESLYAATDRKAQVVSRELTRRVGREPREGRAGRWTA